ncbi:hypothetical protein COS70_04320 [Candidatus Micrarchaeota archaeon CG06_land_8_20_14_3_00_50_6]|nr:MAG: hypothetical protein COS70_04320 [Candidatus Micrarchaeota archaeon CG06_land_8_20_14_3_00_50_6]
MDPLLPCEILVKHYLPAMRAWVAKSLIQDHHLTQVEVAAKLGITQAAVSKYLSGKYDSKTSAFSGNDKIISFLKDTAKKLADSTLSKDALARHFCSVCSTLQGGSSKCGFTNSDKP